MSNRLAIYLHDHLAGSNFAIETLKTLRDEYRDEELGAFAADLLAEVTADRDVLQNIIDRVGRSHLDMKEAAAWLAEKASRFKLQHEDRQGLGTFEVLEALTLGITGKLALWKALPVIAEVDARVGGVDFERLAARAEEQYARVEEQRLELAGITFRTK